jgi:hypothetical protein
MRGFSEWLRADLNLLLPLKSIYYCFLLLNWIRLHEGDYCERFAQRACAFYMHEVTLVLHFSAYNLYYVKSPMHGFLAD